MWNFLSKVIVNVEEHRPCRWNVLLNLADSFQSICDTIIDITKARFF